MKEVQILIVDVDLERAERLRTAVREYRKARGFYDGLEFTQCTVLNDAEKPLLEREFLLVVASPDHEEAELKAFVSTCKATFGGRDAAYVMMVGADDQSEETLALGLLAGMNGFLIEPFSVDSVQETFDLATAVRRQCVEKRQREAIRLALVAAKNLINSTSLCLAGDPGHRARKKDQAEVLEAVRGCVAENEELYFRILVGSFIRDLKNETVGNTNHYTGVSGRVKSLLSARALKKSEAEKP